MSGNTQTALPPETTGCIDLWTEELRLAENDLKTCQADAAKLLEAYKNAKKWSDLLKSLFECIKESDEIGVDIKTELDLYIKHVVKVCKNAECTVESIEILYCDVQTVSKCMDTLKLKISSLLMRVECLNEPKLNAKSSIILGCMDEMSKKLDEAIIKGAEALQYVLEALKQATLIYANICSKQGFKSNLSDLLDYFNAASPASDDSDAPSRGKTTCSATLPETVFPINCSEYYMQTKQQSEDAEAEAIACKDEYDGIREKQDALQTCVNSLKEALEAAKAAKKC